MVSTRSYDPLPLNKVCSRCGHALSCWKQVRKTGATFWRCKDGCEAIFFSSAEERNGLSALKQADKFRVDRNRDQLILAKLETNFSRDAQLLRSNPSVVTEKALQALDRLAHRIKQLRALMAMSSVKYRMAKHLTPGLGRPRRPTLDPGLSVLITISYDAVKMTQVAILQAMGYTAKRHYYTRISQYLTAGRTALAMDPKKYPEHRALQRQVTSLPSSNRQTHCKRLLRRLGTKFLGRKSRPTTD